PQLPARGGRDHEVNPVRQRDRHQIPEADAPGRQRPRHPVALPVEISPADTPLAADDRGRLAALAPEIGEPLGDRDRAVSIPVKIGRHHTTSPLPSTYPRRGSPPRPAAALRAASSTRPTRPRSQHRSAAPPAPD